MTLRRKNIGFFTLMIAQIGLAQNTFQFHASPRNFFKDLLSIARKNSENYLYLPIENYTSSSLYGQYINGKFKQGVAPESSYLVGVAADGIYRNKKKFLFFGSLKVEKIYQKNVRWNLSYAQPKDGLMPDPHYLAVSKEGNWNNQQYFINGGVFIPLIRKLNLLLKTDYHLHKNYRAKYDPRPKITYNQLAFHSGLNYDLSKKNHLKIGAVYGYTHIDNDIIFSNRSKDTPVHYPIYIKWIAGYGSHIYPFKEDIMRRFTRRGFNLGYAYTGVKNLVLIDYSYLKKKQISYKSRNINDYNDPSVYFGIYNPRIQSFNLTEIHHFQDRRLLKIDMESHYFKGNNFLQAKQGKNFMASVKQASINLSYFRQLTEGYIPFILGMGTKIKQVKQQDALSKTLSDIENISINFHASKSFHISKKWSISPFFSTGLSYNVHSKFINGQKNYLAHIAKDDYSGLTLRDYYRQVIYPDNEWFSSNKMNESIGTIFRFISSKKWQTFLRIEAGLNHPLEKLQYFEDDKPNRFNLRFSLNVYY